MREANPSSTYLSKSVEDFIAQIALSKSAPTVQAYSYDVKQFVAFVMDRAKIRKTGALKPKHIVDYLGECKRSGKSDASVNRYYMAIRSYCRYLRRGRLVAFDLTEDVTAPKRSMTVPRVPTKREVEAILEQPNTVTESGLRDRAILELLYSSGLRASELCDLQLNHVGPRKVMVACGKRGKTRTVPMTDEAFEWVSRYIEKCRGSESGPLFLTVMGKAIRRQLLCAIVTGYAEQAGVDEVTPHTLRHACATHLLDEGADLRLIQEVLGHSTIASTQRYTHLSCSKMEEMFTHFHPRKRKEGEEEKC